LVSTKKELMDAFKLTEDGVSSILSSVTTGTQDGGAVHDISDGGWYQGGPKGYNINPYFANDWLIHRGKITNGKAGL
jgi:hypothetical protein